MVVRTAVIFALAFTVATLGLGCGNDPEGDYGLGDGGLPPPPAHTLTLTSDQVTTFVRLTRTGVTRTDQSTTNRNDLRVSFVDPPGDYTLVPHTVDECVIDTSITTTTRTGGAEAEFGSEVFASGTAADFELNFDSASTDYQGTWDTDVEAGPWVPRAWYDVESRAPWTEFSIPDAMGIPTQQLAITSPLAGDAVSFASDLTVTWTPGEESAVVFIQIQRGADGAVCSTTDTGSFSVPAATLAAIPASASPPTVMVHRYYSWRMQRGTEVVHMLANETVIHNGVDP